MIAPDEATRILRSHMRPVAAEAVPLLAALGRVVASPIVARTALPAHDCAAREGFAVRSADLAEPSGAAVSLAFAPRVGPAALPPRTAAWIASGLPLPAGADAVVPADAAIVAGGQVTLPAGVSPGANVRRAGADVALGTCVLAPGELIGATRIALLAALGRESVLVQAPVHVAVMTCGEAYAEPGSPLGPAQVYDGNAFGLMAAIAEAGGRPFRVKARGDVDGIRQALALTVGADLVIATGGRGPGDRHPLLDALDELGTVHFTQVAQEPGGAFAFATVHGKPVIILPGDPADTAICFEVQVRSALRLMMGQAAHERPRVLAIASAPYRREPGRLAYLAARVSKAGPAYYLRLVPADGPGMLGTLAAANALAILPAASRGFEAGDLVEAALLDAPELCGMACLPVGAPGDAPSAVPLRG